MARSVAEKRKTKFLDTIAWIAFGDVAARIARVFNLEQNIRAAGMYTHPYAYVAKVLFVTFIIGLSLGLGTYITWLVYPSIKLVAALGMMAVIVPLMIFAYMLAYPSMLASARAEAVEYELPFFAAYLTTMARSGVSPEKVVETIARIKLFKAISEECKRILRNMKIFGQDPLEAIDAVASTHPSRSFREFMLGYTTTLRTGGDVIHYLEIRTSELFRKKIEEVRSVADRVGLFMEMFAALNVIAALSLYIFFIVSSIAPVGMFTPSLFTLFALIIQPSLTGLMLLLAHKMVPSDPLYNKKYYMYLMISIPVGMVVGVILYMLSPFIAGSSMAMRVASVYISVCVALVVAALGGVKGYLEKRRLEGGLELALSNFLRDLTETRKTGLSIERCITYLAQRNYGTLTNVVKRMAAALMAGISVVDAIRNAVRRLYSWFGLLVFKFLVDAIEYGGAAPQILDMVSHFTSEMAALRDELKRRLRAYVMIPYLAAIILAITSILILGMIAKSMHVTMGILGGGGGTAAYAPMSSRIKVTPETLASISLIAGVGNAINSWVMGLVCGKLREMTVLAGFIHSIILVVIATASALFAFMIGIAPLLH